MGLGFAVAFWGVCGTLFFNDSWRCAYFMVLCTMSDWLYVTTSMNMARMQRQLQYAKIGVSHFQTYCEISKVAISLLGGVKTKRKTAANGEESGSSKAVALSCCNCMASE
ncbi:hypothetical protein RJ640_029907, partial [Escallonia rubra]